MDKEKKSTLLKYLVCFGAASAIVLIVFAIKGFFGSDAKENVHVLADGFSVAGLLLILFSAFLYVSGEGVFLGVGFVVGKAVQALLPGRKPYETYAQYRERKIGKVKKSSNGHILLTGIFFLAVGVVFVLIWYRL